MKRILVTGGAGFIGSHFIRFILETTDYVVVSLDRLDEAANLGRLYSSMCRYPDRLSVAWHDLRSTINPNHLAGQFDWVVHMAAASHVDRSIADPVSFVMDNVVGTANVLEFVRLHLPRAKLLYFSTDEVFGPAPDGVTFDEHAAHYPNNPYAASKAAAEALVPAYVNTYGVTAVVTHCTNVYGPEQYREKFIPLVTHKILANETVQIHSRNGIPSTRFYLHVSDACAAVLAILSRGGTMSGPSTGKYNICGAAEVSNLDVAQRIATLLGHPMRYELVDFVPNRPRHDMRYAVESSRLAALGWVPGVDLDSGLAQVVQELLREHADFERPARGSIKEGNAESAQRLSSIATQEAGVSR